VLYRTGGLEHDVAVVAILLATAASLLVKAMLAATSPNRGFARRVAIWTGVLLAITAVATAFVVA
jgi:uncharacterized membrane protein (DUF4010 family)